MANETITGKIFQLKDPTGTYNRFPRTVMEAVYGLNTYLQNQFGALADIYMPIEGITESKPLQEFVYRACPSSIKAKSVSLDRIYGKTLAWNQVIIDGNFSHGLQYVSNETENVTSSVSNGVLSVTTTQANVGVYLEGDTPISGHKYYCHLAYTATAPIVFRLCGFYSSALAVTSDMTSVSVIGDANVIGLSNIYAASLSDGQCSFQIKNVICVDLTLMFGAGNEPSTVAEFESMFPGYHSYEPGKLISNDAESIETVGFNQWDEEWRDYSHNLSVGSKNPIPVFPSATYCFYVPNSYCAVWYVNEDGTLYGSGAQLDEGNISVFGSVSSLVTIPAGVHYIHFAADAEYGKIYNHDICINLSDPAKNGTYEPYRKSTMLLNLGSFQVRDSQGNVTTIEGGLKSDRSGKYDEIVGNKFIQRAARRAYQSGDENDQTVVTDGTYTDYGLATPIEYELVSPLVPTVKAGITEARISPNADGLSAPMVADMTYSAGQSEDATQAQYAAVAGRLYNSHKLWGQDFDGTQDVTGALTGVTNLNSLLYFGSNNVGIGTVSPQYKLDVAGTFRATGAATLGSALTVTGLTSIAGGVKLTTTKKIWFGDSYWVELHNDGYLLTNAPVVSQSYITAGAVNPNA